MSSEVPALGWLPGWAVAVATLGITLAGGLLVFGFMDLGHAYAVTTRIGGIANCCADVK